LLTQIARMIFLFEKKINHSCTPKL
jgi:hypothetical protein